MSSTTDGSVLATLNTLDQGDLIRIDPDTRFRGFSTCGITKTGPVLLGDDGAWWIGLFGGVGRVDPQRPATACETMEYELGQDKPNVGLFVQDTLVVWTSTHVIFDQDFFATGEEVVVPIELPDGLPHQGTFVARDGRLDLLLAAPVGTLSPRAHLAFEVDVSSRSVGPARTADARLLGQDVQLELDQTTMFATFGSRRSSVSVYPQNDPNSGDRPFVVVADEARERVVVGGPAGFLAEFRADGARLLTTPRLPSLFRVIEGVGGELWGLNDGGVLQWSAVAQPDAVVDVEIIDTSGIVVVGPGRAIFRTAYRLELIEQSLVTVIASQLAGEISAIGQGDLGLANRVLIETVLDRNTGRASLSAHRLNQTLTTRLAFSEVEIAADNVITAAVAPDASAVALLRVESAPSTRLVISRCSITIDIDGGLVVPSCNDLAQTLTPPELQAPLTADEVVLRYTRDGIVGALPGLFFAEAPNDQLVAASVPGAVFGNTDVQRRGNCAFAAFERRLFVLDVASSEPDDLASVTLDSHVASMVAVDTDGAVALIVVGGAESFAQTRSAGQLYRIPLEGCVPQRSQITVPGGLRPQADILGIGIRANGNVIVGDAANILWELRDLP